MCARRSQRAAGPMTTSRSERRPAQQLHALAGSPRMDGCEDASAACVICAATWPRTKRYNDWQGSTFTDQNKLRGHGLSDRVCEPCVWSHAWVAPPDKPANADGTKGLNLRLFSHFADDRGYRSFSKGEKPAIREWLSQPKTGWWWAAIADTGQKHVVPWTRYNPPGARGIVRFEERDVPMGAWSDVETVMAALTAGITKDEITTGQYTARAWTLAEAHVRAVEVLATRHRGSGWWALVVWLAQRDEEAVAARLEAEKQTKAAKKERKNGQGAAARSGARRRGVADDGDTQRVSGERSQSDEPLGPAPRPPASGDAVERDRRDAGDGVAPGPAAGVSQLGLFDGFAAARGSGGR